MRTAPPVSLRCHGGRWLRAAQPGLAGAAIALWAAGWAEQSAPAALAISGLAGVGTGLVAWRAATLRTVFPAREGRQRTADGSAGRRAAAGDLGAWLLLHLRPDGGLPARWIAVGAGEAGAAWHALRAAVFSRPADVTRRASPTRLSH